MPYIYDSKTELRAALQNNRIRRVDFGSPGLLRDERSITLHLEGCKPITIRATTFQTRYIQALPIPEFVPGSDHATAYVNEEGKFDPDCPPNMRATDFFVPGIGIFAGDYIAGACVLLGFDPEVGENRDVPQPVIDRARLIEREAG
jgi:hypothetical protein